MTFFASRSAACVAAGSVGCVEALANWLSELCSVSHWALCLLALVAQSTALVSLAVRSESLSPPPLALENVWQAVSALAWPWSVPQPASVSRGRTSSAAAARRGDTGRDLPFRRRPEGPSGGRTWF